MTGQRLGEAAPPPVEGAGSVEKGAAALLLALLLLVVTAHGGKLRFLTAVLALGRRHLGHLLVRLRLHLAGRSRG